MWLDRLETKIGKFQIPHLMRYLVIGNAVVYILALINTRIISFLSLNPRMVLQGQVWRLFTFVFIPSMGGIFLTLLSLFCYYWIGEALERIWGSFKFTFYCLIGYLSIVAVMFLLLLSSYNLSTMYHLTGYFTQSMFLALATMYPDMRILLFYIIPVKAKWAGLLGAVTLAYELIVDPFPYKMLILASFVAYLLFFLPNLIDDFKSWQRRRSFSRKTSGQDSFYQSERYRQQQADRFRRNQADYGAAGRKADAENRGTQAYGAGPGQAAGTSGASNVRRVPFHRCYVCGITDLDDPNMTFRYCSKCNGNYEYCENHIYNHEHVK